ncbi:MAG TPA: glycosyltransferase family 1 protein [Acidimicrobiales bacterium]
MERPRRVAVTLEQCWHAVPGGTARAALESIRALQAHGVPGELELVGVSARHSVPPPPAWTPSVPVAALPLPRLALYEAWHWLRRPDVQRATGAVDVIHATGMAMPPPSAPIVVTVHDLAFTRDPSQFTRRGVMFFRRAIELARRDATLVICPSRSTLDDCVAQGFDTSRLRLVPWGIAADPADPATVAGARARYGISGRYLLWAGTIEPRKNLAALLDAFAQVDRSDVTLVLVGPQGWNEDLAGRLARLGDRVRALGFVDPDALQGLYAGADVFCYPSREEGFGLPVLEAMAQGTAVVTSSGTATAEVAGDAGVLVDPADVAGLAAALALLLDDDDERGRLAVAGQVRAAEEFTWQRTADALGAVYAEAAP